MKYYVFVILTCLTCAVLPTVVTADLSDGLVAYWPMNGDAQDTSGNEFHGQIFGTVKPVDDRLGNPNGALSFEGATTSGDVQKAYITIGNPDKLRITGALTLAGWVYVRNFKILGRLISKHNSSSCSYNLCIEDDNSPNFYISDDGQAPTAAECTGYGKAKLDQNAWYHLAGVYEPGQYRAIYVNGDLLEKVTNDVEKKMFDSQVNVEIGRRPNCCPLDGILDDLAIWSRALSQEEIRQVMEGHFTDVEPAEKLTVTWGFLKEQAVDKSR